MKGVVKTLWRTDCRPIPGREVAGSHTGIPHETKVGKGRGLTPPNPRVPCCQDPGKGARLDGGSDAPGHGRWGPGRLRHPEPVAGVPAGARTQGSP